MSRSQIQNLIDYVVKSIREEKLTQEEIISYVKNNGVGSSNASWIVHEVNRKIFYGDDETDWDKLTDEAYGRLSKECSSTDEPGDVSPDVVDKGKEENQNTNATDKDETARKQAEEEYVRKMDEYNRQVEEYNRYQEPAEKVKDEVEETASPVKSIEVSKSGFFSGRMSRGSYWMRWIFLALSFGFLIFFLVSTKSNKDMVALFLFGSFIVLSIVLGIRWTTRRLHDTGLSGWWQLFGQFFAGASCALLNETKVAEENLILGIIFAIFTFYYLYRLFLRDSQPGTNKYGPNPKEIKGR